MKTRAINMLSTRLPAFTGFVVTGLLFNSTKRFRKRYDQSGFRTAMCINLWRGSVWGILPDGRRKLLKRSYN